MIDPNSPNQNHQSQQNLKGNSAAVQSQAVSQNESFVDPNLHNNQLSVAKPEFGPMPDSDLSNNKSMENQPIIEQSGEFAEPEVAGEVKDMIKVKRDFPDLDHGAKNAGVAERIPTGPVYGSLPQDLKSAQMQYEEKPTSSADKWRALEAIKNLSRSLLGQPKSSEA